MSISQERGVLTPLEESNLRIRVGPRIFEECIVPTNRPYFVRTLVEKRGMKVGDDKPAIGPGDTITIRNPAAHGEILLTKLRETV